MDTTEFLTNEKPGEYQARFSVHGEISVTIKADSLEDAKAKAAAMTEDEEFGLELDEADDIGVSSVWKSPAMYLVTRDGKKMQVSHLREGDAPREPDERGF